MVDPSDHNRATGQRGETLPASPELAAASRSHARREIPSGTVPADLPPSQGRRLYLVCKTPLTSAFAAVLGLTIRRRRPA